MAKRRWATYRVRAYDRKSGGGSRNFTREGYSLAEVASELFGEGWVVFAATVKRYGRIVCLDHLTADLLKTNQCREKVARANRLIDEWEKARARR